MNRKFLITVFDRSSGVPRALTAEEAEREGLGAILLDFKQRLLKGIDFYQVPTDGDLPIVDSLIIVRGKLTDYYKDVSGVEHTRFVSVDSEPEANVKLNDVLFVCTSEDRKDYTVSLFMEALLDGVVLSAREKVVLSRHLVI